MQTAYTETRPLIPFLHSICHWYKTFWKDKHLEIEQCAQCRTLQILWSECIEYVGKYKMCWSEKKVNSVRFNTDFRAELLIPKYVVVLGFYDPSTHLGHFGCGMHTVPGQASYAVYQYLVHILLPVVHNCPSWISGRERMVVEIISLPNSTKEFTGREDRTRDPPHTRRTRIRPSHRARLLSLSRLTESCRRQMNRQKNSNVQFLPLPLFYIYVHSILLILAKKMGCWPCESLLLN